MAALLLIVGLLAALAGGAIGAFTVNQTVGIAIGLGILALAILAMSVLRTLAKLILVVLVVVLVGSVALGGIGAAQVLSGLRSTSGTADPPDPVAYASAERKVEDARNQGGFRLQLSESELEAVLQNALTESSATPVKHADLVIIDGTTAGEGALDFTVTFKGGGLDAQGRVGAALEAGRIALQVQDMRLGRFNAPPFARGAVEDLIRSVFDVNDALTERRVTLQSLTIGNHEVVAIGTQAGGPLLTSGDLLGALSDNAKRVAGAVAPPAERLGPGDVNATQLDGARYYVAIGDSLAANLGVTSPRDGYVSRLLKQLGARDGTTYGLRNFGISAETSASLIASGQLERALTFMRANQVAYVTIDIGANDLLGHLGSADCATDLRAPACQQRLTPTLAAYRPNLERVLREVRAASKDAKVYFLGAYNPFSLGFGSSVGLETATDDALKQLNDIARQVAQANNVVFVDGQTPMQRTAAATTGMLLSPPDIHPNGSGHDILAAAILDAVR